jgi:hypothetical protein
MNKRLNASPMFIGAMSAATEEQFKQKEKEMANTKHSGASVVSTPNVEYVGTDLLTPALSYSITFSVEDRQTMNGH